MKYSAPKRITYLASEVVKLPAVGQSPPHRSSCLAPLIIGSTLLILGVLQGELSHIFAKGSIVCLECIGIG
jgi:hypothetical protein